MSNEPYVDGPCPNLRRTDHNPLYCERCRSFREFAGVPEPASQPASSVQSAADVMRKAARAKPQGVHVELTNGQWFRSCNNDFKPQAVWTLEEAREVQRWLSLVLP